MERQFGRSEAHQPFGGCLVYSKNGAVPCDLGSSVRASPGEGLQTVRERANCFSTGRDHL